MISLPDYKVMGEDGQEYGPVSDDQIRKWIMERRLERKTPVKPPDARDWVCLDTLPAFTDVLQPPAPPPKPQRRKWPWVIWTILAAGLLLWALKKLKHH